MARITLDDSLHPNQNRFELTLAAPQRARQIASGSPPRVDPQRNKPIVIALRELAAGKTGPEVIDKV